jgi:hypothetical protein
MMHVPEPDHIHREAQRRLAEVIREAVVNGADGITVEFAKEGGLEVCFMFGNTGIGGVLVPRELESAVMEIIAEKAGLGDGARGTMLWKVNRQDVRIDVTQYENFGESAFDLAICSRRGKKKRSRNR